MVADGDVGEPASQNAVLGIAAHRAMLGGNGDYPRTVTAQLSLSRTSLVRLLSLTGSQTEFVLASIDGSTKVQVEVAVSSVPDAELSLANGSVILDWQRWTITHGANRVTLSRTELRLLAALMEKAPAPASREQLVSRLWPTDPSRTSDRDGAVAVWVFALRKRFAAIGLPDAIRTVRSIGYCLDL